MQSTAGVQKALALVIASADQETKVIKVPSPFLHVTANFSSCCHPLQLQNRKQISGVGHGLSGCTVFTASCFGFWTGKAAFPGAKYEASAKHGSDNSSEQSSAETTKCCDPYTDSPFEVPEGQQLLASFMRPSKTYLRLCLPANADKAILHLFVPEKVRCL